MALCALLFLLTVFDVSFALLTAEYGGSGGEEFWLYNQGRISGVQSWGVTTGTFEGITIKKWSADKQSNANGETVPYQFGTSQISSSCPPFTLASDEYINGYRVVYDKSYVLFLGFIDSSGHRYICQLSFDAINKLQNVQDSGWITLDSNLAMYGFYVRLGGVIDAIQFQFEPVTKSPTIYPSLAPTTQPTFIPTPVPNNNVPSLMPSHRPTFEVAGFPSFGVVIGCVFESNFSMNETNVIVQTLETTIDKIVNDTLEKECVQSGEYSIKTFQTSSMTLLNTTVPVCSSGEENTLLTAIGGDGGKLESDLVQKLGGGINRDVGDMVTVRSESITSVKKSGVIKSTMNSPSSSSSLDLNTSQTGDMLVGHALIMIVLIAIICALVVLVLILCFLYCRKRRRKSTVGSKMEKVPDGESDMIEIGSITKTETEIEGANHQNHEAMDSMYGAHGQDIVTKLTKGSSVGGDCNEDVDEFENVYTIDSPSDNEHEQDNDIEEMYEEPKPMMMKTVSTTSDIGCV